MKSTPPKISILMPSYNQGSFLEAAIQSVLTQDYPNKELILVDGGSTDESVEIIQRYQPKLAYAVSEPDRGQAHALNKALPRATGEIVGWLNSDDLYLPGAFSSVARAFKDHPEALLVHGNRIMIDRNGNVSGWTKLPAFDPATTGFIVCSDTAFWRKDLCPDSRFDENLRFAMDVDFFCRLYRLGPFVKLPDYLGAFRCHATSKSATISDVGEIEARAIWRRIFPDQPEGPKSGGPQLGKLENLMVLLQHPLMIALPYLHRRFVLGRRGMNLYL